MPEPLDVAVPMEARNAPHWSSVWHDSGHERAEPVPVRLEEVTKVYVERARERGRRRRRVAEPTGVRALDGVSLTVGAGRFTVLLGPSGSGKSTLLRCVAGTDRPTTGSVLLGERCVAGPEAYVPPERRDLSMVFQDYALWPHLTAVQNVAFALRRRRVSASVGDRRCQEMLARLGLGDLADRYPGELSGGEQQRVALARALVAGTGLLLCDEPLSNLDADRRERLRVEIALAARASGATVLYITHDQAEAFALADVVAVLDRGRVVQTGAPEEIYGWPGSPFVARFTGLAGEVAGNVRGVSGDEGGLRGEPLLEVDAAGGVLVTRAPVGIRPEPGAAVMVCVRPSAVSLHAPSGTAPVPGTLRGTVLDTAYRGSGYDHVVEVGDGAVLVGVRSEGRWERGGNVEVRVQSSGCFAYADDGGEGEVHVGGQRAADAGVRRQTVEGAGQLAEVPGGPR